MCDTIFARARVLCIIKFPKDCMPLYTRICLGSNLSVLLTKSGERLFKFVIKYKYITRHTAAFLWQRWQFVNTEYGLLYFIRLHVEKRPFSGTHNHLTPL